MIPASRVEGFAPSVFSEFSRLAAASGAVNLGQGFPDFDGPDEVKRAAAEALAGGVNQYAVSTGDAALKRAVAAHADRFYGQRVDPADGVIITAGATEAIFDTVMAFVNPGDEVVLFEPYYDSYVASVQMAQGVPRYVRLHEPDARHETWWLDERELAAAFTDKTKLVLLNTPNNPTGKVFTRDELELIGALCRRAGAVLVSDEVYEHLVFSGKHLRPATLPGLEALTLTISSGGKSFSFTGWKVGWALGPSSLVQAVQRAHQWVTFCAPAPFQRAMAVALALPDAYFSGFVETYRARRDFLAKALRGAGLTPLLAEGTYFLMARTEALKPPHEDDVSFCRRLLGEAGVASIPPSVFYSTAHAHHAHGLARFAFCKTQPVLDEAARRLAKYAMK